MSIDRGFSIRRATVRDVAELFAVRTSVRENHQSTEELAEIGVTPERIAEMLETTSAAWLAEADNRAIAFSMANAAEATVFAMFVRPEFEGRGLGRKLMAAAEDWLFDQGLDEIWLSTGGDPMLRANGFYEHLGWKNDGRLPDGQNRYIKVRGGS